MSRIDAVIATQVADIVRPTQSGRETQLQTEEAKIKEVVDEEKDGSNGKEVKNSDLRAAAAQIQQVVEAAGLRSLVFGFGQDQKTKDPYLVIREQESGKLIRQIPGKEVMALRDRIREMIGIMFDEKA